MIFSKQLQTKTCFSNLIHEEQRTTEIRVGKSKILSGILQCNNNNAAHAIFQGCRKQGGQGGRTHPPPHPKIWAEQFTLSQSGRQILPSHYYSKVSIKQSVLSNDLV